MKVIFLQDVPQLAQAGQIKEVADGYARNYLIPRKLAALAQPHSVSQIEVRAKKMEAHLAAELEEMAGQLEGKEVSLKAKAGAKEKLYGSITSADIAAELKNATGLEIDKRKIGLEEPIRQLGSYEVVIKLGKDITSTIKVTVTEEEAKAEEKPAKKTRKKKEAEEAPAAEVKAEAEKPAKKEKKAPAKAKKAAEKKVTKKAAKEEEAAPKAEKKTTKKATKAAGATEKKTVKKATKAKKEEKAE